MDTRLLSRVDPSDIVQEALIDAAKQLDHYLRDRPLPFYPWLRSLAWNRLVDLHRRHVMAGKRSVDREIRQTGFSDESVALIARHLTTGQTSVGRRLVRQEVRQRVIVAMDQLPNDYREALMMRHVEQLSVTEIAAIVGVAEGTVKSRVFRAIQRLQKLLSDYQPEEPK